MTSEGEPATPIPTGPFFSNYGPRDGDILEGQAPVMGVLGSRDGSSGPIGIAWHDGSIMSRRGPVQVWELEVNKVRLEGRWICRRRRFERLGDATEEL